MLFGNGPEIGVATLKNIKLRSLFNTLPADIWATLKKSSDDLCFSSQKNGLRRLLGPGPKSVLRRFNNITTLDSFPFLTAVSDAENLRRQFWSAEYYIKCNASP